MHMDAKGASEPGKRTLVRKANQRQIKGGLDKEQRWGRGRARTLWRPVKERLEGRTETSAQVSVGSPERSTGLLGESPQQVTASGYPRLQAQLGPGPPGDPLDDPPGSYFFMNN